MRLILDGRIGAMGVIDESDNRITIKEDAYIGMRVSVVATKGDMENGEKPLFEHRHC